MTRARVSMSTKPICRARLGYKGGSAPDLGDPLQNGCSTHWRLLRLNVQLDELGLQFFLQGRTPPDGRRTVASPTSLSE